MGVNLKNSSDLVGFGARAWVRGLRVARCGALCPDRLPHSLYGLLNLPPAQQCSRQYEVLTNHSPEKCYAYWELHPDVLCAHSLTLFGRRITTR